MVEARDMIAFIALRYLGLLTSEIGRPLRISKQIVLRGAGKGEKLFAERGWSAEEVIKN